MIDTHCHIHFPAYDADRDEVLARSRERSVGMIAIGTKLDSSKAAVDLAAQQSDIWCTIGVHPSHTHEGTLHQDDHEDSEVQQEAFDGEVYRALAASSNKVVAIGEVGLDYYRLPSDGADAVVAAQKRELKAALDLADELNLPVGLHVRDAHADMVAMLGEYRAAHRLVRCGVVHCFTGTIDEAQAYHALGFLTSFTGIITFSDRKRPDELTELMKTVQALPLEMTLVETDAPYLAPQAHRGRRCEPWMVTLVAQKIAELKGVSMEEVDRVTTENARRLFGISFP